MFVFHPQDGTDAEAALYTLMVEKRFGEAGQTVIIEEMLSGPELTLLMVGARHDGECAGDADFETTSPAQSHGPSASRSVRVDRACTLLPRAATNTAPTAVRLISR